MTSSTLIDSGELARHLDEPDWVLFDCRFDLADTDKGGRAWAQAHIPGAFYAHMDCDLSDPIRPDSGRHPLPDPMRLARWLGAHGVSRSSQVVVYDDSGGTMAVRLWWLLRWLGHNAVAVLDGGWPAWCAAGLPVTARGIREVPRPRATPFDGRPDMTQVVTTADILRGRLEGMLVDVRTAERFRGEQEPIDPVAGHIPGALNMPLQRHLSADGRFLDGPALRALYGSIGIGDGTGVTFMCGSGVTACHGILALAIAGFPAARLYAGSWSEWIRDAEHPVARGGV